MLQGGLNIVWISVKSRSVSIREKGPILYYCYSFYGLYHCYGGVLKIPWRTKISRNVCQKINSIFWETIWSSKFCFLIELFVVTHEQIFINRKWKREFENASKNERNPKLWRALLRPHMTKFILFGLYRFIDVMVRWVTDFGIGLFRSSNENSLLFLDLSKGIVAHSIIIILILSCL